MPLKHMPLSFAESVDFDFHDFPAECSAASVSGSSYASSSFGPLTPTSGRSTPSFSTSLDMGSSFASSVDTVPFDMTPPSSATSTYFPTTPKMDSLPDFAYRAFPTTLSRGQPGHPVYPLGGYDAQLTPSHTMDGGFFLNQLGPSPLPLMSTPSAPTHFGHPPESAWGHADSLISFEQQVPRDLPEVLSSSIKLEPQNDVMTPLLLADTARKRAKMEEARHKTTALDQAQQRTQASARRQVKRERRLCALKGKESTMSVDSVEPRSKFHCPHPGCTFGPYQRKEHLMRHIDSIHGKGKAHKCNWCEHTSNRLDNMTSHLFLHTRPNGSSDGTPRVKFFLGAVREYEELQKLNRARRRRGSKLKKENANA